MGWGPWQRERGHPGQYLICDYRKVVWYEAAALIDGTSPYQRVDLPDLRTF